MVTLRETIRTLSVDAPPAIVSAVKFLVPSVVVQVTVGVGIPKATQVRRSGCDDRVRERVGGRTRIAAGS